MSMTIRMTAQIIRPL